MMVKRILVSHGSVNLIVVVVVMLLSILTHPGPLTFFANTIWLVFAASLAFLLDLHRKHFKLLPYVISGSFAIVMIFAEFMGRDVNMLLVTTTIPSVLMAFLGVWLCLYASTRLMDSAIFWTTILAAFFTFLFYAWIPFFPPVTLPMSKGIYTMSFPFTILSEYPRLLTLPSGDSIPFFRNTSFFFEPGAYSFFLVWALLISIRRLGQDRRYFIGIIVLFATLLLSGSVGGLVAFAITIFAEISISKQFGLHAKAMGLVLVFLIGALMMSSSGNFTLEDRLNSDSYGDREHAVKVMSTKFYENPIVPMIQASDESVSSFIAIIGQYKILGVLAISVLLIRGIFSDASLLFCLIGSASHQPLTASVLFYYLVARLLSEKIGSRGNYISSFGRFLFSTRLRSRIRSCEAPI